MRTIILILLTACLFCRAYSQSEIQGRFRIGPTIQRDGVLLEDDACIFSMSDGNLRGRWVLELDTKSGTCNIKEQDAHFGSFSFSVRELQLQKYYYDTNSLKQYVFENDSSVYFKGSVVFQDAIGDIIDCFPIRLNLLPAMPKLKNVTLECEGFDWEMYQLINPIVNFYFTSSRERKYIIKCCEDGFNSATSFSYPNEKVNINAGVRNMFFDDLITSWEDYYILSVQNDYGSVTSRDTIRLYDYINNSDLLNDYEKWKDMVTSINLTSEDTIDIYYNQVDRTLCIKGLCGFKNVRIFANDGLLSMHHIGDEEKVSLSELNRGIYIVCIEANKRFVCRKIIIN